MKSPVLGSVDHQPSVVSMSFSLADAASASSWAICDWMVSRGGKNPLIFWNHSRGPSLNTYVSLATLASNLDSVSLACCTSSALMVPNWALCQRRRVCASWCAPTLLAACVAAGWPCMRKSIFFCSAASMPVCA